MTIKHAVPQILVILAITLAFAAAIPAQTGRDPNSLSGGGLLSDLDHYRLWAVRETAMKRQDVRAIEKIAEISRRVGTRNVWSPKESEELHHVMEQLEARLGITPATAVPQQLKPEDYPFAVARREMLNVRFANTEGVQANLQSLDVHAPAEGTGHPIIVWLHGGGMKGGDKAQAGVTVLKRDFFLARGYIFASVNYRLAPEQTHPAQAEDTAAALAWLHDHAAEFGGDSDRIFVIGISAGAQLAAVVSTNERFLAKHQKALSIIKGAVILDIGSFDIPTLMEQAGDRAPEMYRYTFRNGGNREDWIDCSPLYHVQRGKSIPPMLLYYVAGREHHAIENERFAARMKEEGCEASVLAAEGKTHVRIELEIGTSDDVPTNNILKFFDRQCRLANVSPP